RGRAEELSGPVRARAARIALVLCHERESRRGRHLDDGRLPAIEASPPSADGATQWIRDHTLAILAGGRLDDSPHGALAAVGDGDEIDDGVGPDGAKALRDRFGHGASIGGSLECLWRDDDAARERRGRGGTR